MARRPRIKLADVPIHILQRGKNKNACFFAEEDYLYYLEQLEIACAKYSADLHAFVLLDNHAHLLLTPTDDEGASKIIKQLSQRYVRYINRRYQRSTPLWEGRFRSSVVGEAEYFLACQQYIELNPVRLDIVNHPGEYSWSSYRQNAQGDTSSLIKPHTFYQQLGSNPESRQEAYQDLFRYLIDPGMIDKIRQSTNGGYVLGTEKFQQQVADQVGMPTWRKQRSRSST